MYERTQAPGTPHNPSALGLSQAGRGDSCVNLPHGPTLSQPWQGRLWGQKHHSLVPQGKPEGPRGSGESSVGSRDWPLIGTETSDISILQEASEKGFKRFAQIRQWGAGDLTRPFPTVFPQSDIHRLVTSDGTYPVIPTP